MLKKGYLLIVALFMGMLLLVGCSEGTSSEEQNEGTGSNEANEGQEETEASDGVTLENTFLNVGATSQSSGLYSYFVAIANSVEKATDGKINMTVVETGASVDNLVRLQQGSIDIGLGTESINYKALNGLDDWEDKPMPELRNLFAFLPIALPFTVSEESGVTSISDLDGKSFFPGFTGSATETTTQEVLNLLNIEPNYFLGGLEDGVNAVKDRRAVGMVKTGVGTEPDPTVVEINTTLPQKLIGFNEEEKKIVESELGLPFMIIPAGSFPNQEEDIETVVVVMDVFTSTDLPEEVAYHIVKASVENKSMHEDAYGGVKPYDYIEATLDYATTPLHAGVVKYFREIGVDIPDHLIPPESK
ncbi:TAXI family TRAP transporter solute-binding subunit [Alkalihalobacterium alkalinitrilicum]|uniref:TAXI family TRAP transporter solute-binding subunit n=1 Tax=Alkalihalobacterium alkalinitrilicum TaxID=427920 RepID=UPI00099564F1|nr:TAXI family TRAP transporter solute-binding subunit [Alkalihalobacterium alkalinitrilicum]